jgi:hypothetical protein
MWRFERRQRYFLHPKLPCVCQNRLHSVIRRLDWSMLLFLFFTDHEGQKKRTAQVFLALFQFSICTQFER